MGLLTSAEGLEIDAYSHESYRINGSSILSVGGVSSGKMSFIKAELML